MPNLYDKEWFKIIAECYSLELIHRAKSSWGWNRIRYSILQDLVDWNKTDLIIISPSLFSRVDVIEMNVDSPSELETNPWIEYVDLVDKRYKFVEDEWANLVKFLYNNNYNIYTWAFEEVKHNVLPSECLISPPVPYRSWSDWNLDSSENWIIPYPHPGGDGGKMLEKDSHFSNKAHIKLSEHFINHIDKYEKSKSSSML